MGSEKNLGSKQVLGQKKILVQKNLFVDFGGVLLVVLVLLVTWVIRTPNPLKLSQKPMSSLYVRGKAHE